MSLGNDQSERAATPPVSPHLRVSGITKNFGSVEVLRGASLEVRRGEVMALVGDNGAGKSTLMKVVSGAHAATQGRFEMDNSEVFISNPLEAEAHGIQIVYQDLALCQNLDVSANLFLGHEPVKGGFWKLLPKILRPLDHYTMEQKSRQAVDRLGVRTLNSVSAEVGVLSGGQRQAVAIARAIKSESSVVLLDEPTAALGVVQTAQVLEAIRRLRDSDHGVIFISHNLKDVFEVADRITVLRLGATVGVWETNKTTPDEIVVAMTSGGTADEKAGK